MNRRNFLKNSSAAGLVTTFGISGTLAAATMVDKDSPNYLDNFELNEATIHQLQEQLGNGKLSSKALTKLYLKRINEIDKNGIKLNSVIEINPDAIEIATKLDQEEKRERSEAYFTASLY